MVIYVYRKNLFGDITEIYQGATCVALIPGVGLFAVLGGALVSIGVMELINWAVEEYGLLDSVKDWIEGW